ncbi:hypothetical protein SFRURICE_005946, partial [Spodoptera frugiperda]
VGFSSLLWPSPAISNFFTENLKTPRICTNESYPPNHFSFVHCTEYTCSTSTLAAEVIAPRIAYRARLKEPLRQMGPSRADALSRAADYLMGYQGSGSKSRCRNRPASYASHAPHATDYRLPCIETHTTASTDPHRTPCIINAYMRCVLMTSYGMDTMRAIHKEGTFERQVKYNNINNVCLSVSPLVKLFARSKTKQRCTLRYVVPLYNVHPLFTICVKSPINTLPDPGIEPDTPYPVVPLATTQPTSCMKLIIKL